MKPVAILQTETTDIDTIILWDDSDRIVAVAYHDGKVKLTRPLEAVNVTGAAQEALDALNITQADLTLVGAITPRPIAALPNRWHGVAHVRNQQHRQALKPVTLQPVNWQPQVEVNVTRDVCGWLDHDRGYKFQFASGSTHLIDEQHAIEFIVKGYATGKLPRHVSADEAETLRSVMTVIGMGQATQSRNGGA